MTALKVPHIVRWLLSKDMFPRYSRYLSMFCIPRFAVAPH